MEGTDSGDLNGERSSPTLAYLLLYTLFFALRHQYRSLSIGKLCWLWIGVAMLIYATLQVLEVHIEIVAMFTGMPASLGTWMGIKWHEKYVID